MQEDVPWERRRDENVFIILDDLNKVIVAVTEADALSERQEEEASVCHFFKEE